MKWIVLCNKCNKNVDWWRASFSIDRVGVLEVEARCHGERDAFSANVRLGKYAYEINLPPWTTFNGIITCFREKVSCET